jgi:predicted amidohydrolase YtcJ
VEDGLKSRILLGCLLILIHSACSQEEPAAVNPAGIEVVVYRAQSVITMDAEHPRAAAVAVDGDRIAAVGSLPEIEHALSGRNYRIDDRFADKVLMPGFIDPHLHPYLAGILLPMEFITPHDWNLPGHEVEGVRGREAYLERLRAHEAELDDDEWVWTWGYHQLFHGELSRTDLDAISTTRPILVWHRSFHEIYANSAALKALEIDQESVGTHPQADFPNGHFYENGMKILLPTLVPRLLEPGRYIDALRQAREVIHAGGITSIGDANFGALDLEMELKSLVGAGWDSQDTPFRTMLIVDGKSLGEARGHEQVRKMIEDMPRRDLHRIRFAKRQVKLFADGAAYSQAMQMSEPYLDGHEGEWMMTPAELEAAARVYWNADFQINVHVNGDKGLDRTLEILEKLQREYPRQDHRFTIHHLAYARPDQAQRLADLGGMVQANPYYLWALGDKYSEVGLGPERASHMVPLNSFVATGMRVAFHSDFTMAPAQPLLLAWAALTRITAEGNILGLDERLTLQQALRGITIDAAYQLGTEQESGSIEVGKIADFTVLEQDPFDVSPETLKDIPIWGTVFEGGIFPLGDLD